jgi:hypothetical protein
MAGWIRAAMTRRFLLVAALTVGTILSAVVATPSHAQEPATNRITNGDFEPLEAGLNSIKMLPCIDQETHDKLLDLFKDLEAYANEEGYKFIADGDPDAAKASADATKLADELQPLIYFLKSMPICAGPMPWGPGGGGGPNDGWPPSVTPPSHTPIPPCFNDDAKTMIENLEKKMPEEEQNIAAWKEQMAAIRQDIIDASSEASQATA